MNILSKKKCFWLMKKMEMMDHIVDHSIMVSNVAYFLSEKLKIFSPQLDSNLAASAALLHDITKTRSFNTREIHSETGCQMLIDLGYPEVGDIIRQHVLLDHYHKDTPVSEHEIVNYSDKRILHNKVVSLDKRLRYIEKRYGSQKKIRHRMQFVREKTLALEKKLFSPLDISPDQLSGRMKKKLKKKTCPEEKSTGKY